MGRAGISGNDAHVEGVINRLVTAKGFGFIGEIGVEGNELFFHMSDLAAGRFDDLKEGDKVRFIPTTTPKGRRAEKVERF